MLCPTPSKTPYSTGQVAQREMLKILSRSKAWDRPNHPVRVYECPCGQFHLTHKGTTPETPVDVVDARFKLAAL